MMNDLFWKWYDDFAAPRLSGRSHTFRKMFEHLDSVGGRGPVRVVETGCIEDPDNWAGNGCSTILFDTYARMRPGSQVCSVDVVMDRVVMAREHVSYATEIRCGDSVEALRHWAKRGLAIDLLYLDASHLYWENAFPAQVHHLNELNAAMPMLRASTLVAVDDSPAAIDDFPSVEVGGKGGLVAKHAFAVGADLAFLEYQVGWTNMTNKPSMAVESVEDLIGRARRHVEADRMTAANFLYRRVLELTRELKTPVHRVARGEACMHFGKLALTIERFGKAADWYREASAADPACVEYRVDLATKCYYQMGAIDAALSEAKRATRIEPENPLGWHALGVLRHEKGDLEGAADAHDREIVAGGGAGAVLNRATAALDMEDYALVEGLCSQVIEREIVGAWTDGVHDDTAAVSEAISGARVGDAKHVMAMAAFRQGRHEDACDLFDAALADGARDPGVVHWHKSLAMECLGRYPEAWAEREERANQTKMEHLALPYRRFPTKPLWDGLAPVGGQVIHVHGEAGAGDNIAMMRYFPALAEMGFRVRYEAMADLVELARQSFPDVEVVEPALDFPGPLGLKNFDCHVPIGGLQHRFGATCENNGWRGPYIGADSNNAQSCEALLSKRFRVGLCWSSGIRLGGGAWLERYGRQKSMKCSQMGFTLLNATQDALERFEFVSLQVGPERAQMRDFRISDVLPDRPDWIHTAALISRLDLVITVDTAVAHLAGAMGKPVWVMVPVGAGGSWHWMSERPGALWNERSPWYPSARVFRQLTPGDWNGVLLRVAEALAGVPDAAMAGVAAE